MSDSLSLNNEASVFVEVIPLEFNFNFEDTSLNQDKLVLAEWRSLVLVEPLEF